MTLTPGFRWHLWPRMFDHGLTRPADLAKAATISKPAAKALLADNQPPIKKLDIPTLLAIARVFECLDDPMELLEYIPPPDDP